MPRVYHRQHPGHGQLTGGFAELPEVDTGQDVGHLGGIGDEAVVAHKVDSARCQLVNRDALLPVPESFLAGHHCVPSQSQDCQFVVSTLIADGAVYLVIIQIESDSHPGQDSAVDFPSLSDYLGCRRRLLPAQEGIGLPIDDVPCVSRVDLAESDAHNVPGLIQTFGGCVCEGGDILHLGSGLAGGLACR